MRLLAAQENRTRSYVTIVDSFLIFPGLPPLRMSAGREPAQAGIKILIDFCTILLYIVLLFAESGLPDLGASEYGPEVARIEALIRALDDLRHWTEDAARRQRPRDVRQQRMMLSTLRLREEALDRSLLAAYDLFEIDGLHAAWCEMRGGNA